MVQRIDSSPSLSSQLLKKKWVTGLFLGILGTLSYALNLEAKALNEARPPVEVRALGIYEPYVPPERYESVAPVFAKPDTPWPVDYWGHSRGFYAQWDDPGSTENKAGVKEDGSRTFWNAKAYPFEEVDLEAFAEQAFNHYTPYAVGMLPYAVRWQKMKLTTGLYQFKLGQWNDGSEKTTLRGLNRTPSPQSLREMKVQSQDFQVIMVSKGGKVMAVFPVMERQSPPEKFHPFRQVVRQDLRHHPQWGKLGPLEQVKARIDESEGRPTTNFDLNEVTGIVRLSVCQKNQCFITRVQAADVYSHTNPLKESATVKEAAPLRWDPAPSSPPIFP